MLGNFSYCNPTKLYFGENSLSNLSDELKKYGDNVVLIYGTCSMKRVVRQLATYIHEFLRVGLCPLRELDYE